MTHQFTPDESPRPNIRGHLTSSPPPEEPDHRYLPESQEEQAVVAHVRGWCHLSTICLICRVETAHAQDRMTLKSIIEGS